MRIRVLGAVATAAALLSTVPTAFGPAANAAGNAKARYVVLSGDSKYLVYAEAVQRSALDPISLPAHANLYALGRTGKPMSLGKAGAGGGLQLVSLSQSMVVVVNTFKTGHRVRWWNLDSGKSGDLSSNEHLLGATPDGWITRDGGYPDGKHVVARSVDGDIVDYGNPLQKGVDFGIAVGPNGFVAYADNFLNDNGEITYTPWAHPTVHRVLAAPGGKNVRCDSVSPSYAACLLGGGSRRAVALFALRGNHRTTGGGRCVNEATVWGTRVAWDIALSNHGCRAGHLGQMTQLGTTRLSKLRFNPAAITTAWRRLVTSRQGQGALVTLGAIRGTPKPLKRANI
ncbi:MAG TPA: hypothetical protein VHC43_07035 [Mycobacteriales bacterium]|nr:hypothetical protein [Mycobacteriales bacterium]